MLEGVAANDSIALGHLLEPGMPSPVESGQSGAIEAPVGRGAVGRAGSSVYDV